MTIFLVELYVPGAEAASVERVAARARAAAEALTREGQTVRYLQTVCVPAEETCFCLFSATSCDAVRAAQERAGLVPTRIVEALTDRAAA